MQFCFNYLRMIMKNHKDALDFSSFNWFLKKAFVNRLESQSRARWA